MEPAFQYINQEGRVALWTIGEVLRISWWHQSYKILIWQHIHHWQSRLKAQTLMLVQILALAKIAEW